jgi:hypothetical protein
LPDSWDSDHGQTHSEGDDCPGGHLPEELPDGLDEGVKASLARLRHLTKMTGAIHDAQLLQLKVWPRVLFPCDQHTVQHDGEQRVLIVTMRLSEALPEGDALKQRIKAFERWCWALLGPEWSIRLRARAKKGGKAKEIHHGRRKAPLPKEVTPEKVLGMEAVAEFRRYRKPNQAAAAQAVAEELEPLLPGRTK